MLEGIAEFLKPVLGLGLDAGSLNLAQIAVRAVLVYAFTVLFVQLDGGRLLSRATVFDYIVAIMLGSIMSRAIIGGPLLQSIGAGAVLIVLHWLLAFVSYHTSFLGPFVKGNRVLLIEDGKVMKDQMSKANLSEKDLLQALRIEVGHEDPSRIKEAYLERNGKISAIPYEKKPRILTTSIENGVQSLRIELE